MPATINTNLSSLTAQRNSTKSQNDLTTAINRLSSGLRINSAKDDAAGLAITERFTAQIRGLNQAARNANDGISLSQVAEGALASVGSNLQRIRELAVQSANATNSASDRAALQNEVAQLVSEIDRVGAQTQFNGLSLLDGSFTAQQFQVGANANQTISISSISSARTADLRGLAYTTAVTGSTVSSTALATGALSINGTAIQAAVAGGAAGQSADSAFAVAAAINASQTSVVATAVTPPAVTGSAPTTFTAITAGELTINGVDVLLFGTVGSAVVQGADVATSINAISASTGVTANANGTTGALTLTATDGRNIVIGGTAAGFADSGLSASTFRGSVNLTSTTAQGISIGGTAPTNAGLTAGTTAATNLGLTGASVADLSVATVSGANSALETIDAALTSINSERAKLGAIQNRFSSTVENLQTTSENLAASRSRIQDADFAAETAALSRAQVLQQAGTAMIAQANQLPQGVLALLR